MVLNYTSWVCWDGNKEGVIEVHHEFLRAVFDNETTTIAYEALSSVRVKTRNPPKRDQCFLTDSSGEEHKLEFEQAEMAGFVEAIPRSFHIGW